jgi:dihydropteroate synthase
MSVAQENRNVQLDRARASLQIRDRELRFGSRTFVMGIVNVTPDSFSGDGVLNAEAAVALATQQIADGADIIDIGGQSTRPGYEPIEEKTECERILPVIAKLRKVSDVIISVDTFAPTVFEKAVDAGADMLNSIWGLSDGLLEIARAYKAPVVIMHNKVAPKYATGVIEEITGQLHSEALRALASGLEVEQIILDPGIGFGKTAEQNLEVLSALDEITKLGFPTLIGTSRKSTIGKVTGRSVDKRIYGTAASVALAIAAGIDIVRVHDVQAIVDVVKTSDAIVRNWRPHDWHESFS